MLPGALINALCIAPPADYLPPATCYMRATAFLVTQEQKVAATALLLLLLATQQTVSFVSQHPPKSSQNLVGTATTAAAASVSAATCISVLGSERQPLSADGAGRYTIRTSATGSPACGRDRPPTGAGTLLPPLSYPALGRQNSLVCYSAAAAADASGAGGAGADEKITRTTRTSTSMATEEDMPALKVLRVDEVPTVKADPVDPVAREQAKVRGILLQMSAVVRLYS